MITEIIIAAVPSILSAIVIAKLSDANRKSEKLEEDRNKRELLILKSLDATASVQKELVRCVRGEKPNGELTEAFNYHTEVKHELEGYMREKAADL